MRNLLIIVLALISLNVYGQRKQTIRELVVKDSLAIQAGNPDSNKIAVSVDANGKFKWVYFTDFQDSLNTAIYDTTTANVVVTQAIRITGATFASDTLVSIGTSGTVTKCFATCDTIQYILDNLGGAQLWDSTGSNQSFVYPNPNTLGLWIGDTTGMKDVVVNSPNIDFFVGAQTGIINGVVGTTGDTTVTISFGTVGEGGFGVEVNDGVNTTSFSVRAGVVKIDDGTAQDGYVFTATDANGNATWQDHTAYGEMGFGDSLRTIALTQNVFSVVTNTAKNLWSTAAVDLHNVTYSGDSLIIDSAGTYQVNIQLSMDGTNGSVIRLGVFLNGVLACSCTGYEELSSNKIIQLSYINIDQLNANDVLQVVVTNTANNDDVDVVAGKITINKIR
jgi:hypothetical protein